MKKLNSNIYLIIVFVLTQFISSNILAENPKSTLSLLRKKLSTIKSAAEQFDVNWKTMVGVIYVERTNNVDWSDEAHAKGRSPAPSNESRDRYSLIADSTILFVSLISALSSTGFAFSMNK